MSQPLIEQALVAHRRGRFDEACRLCERVLASTPRHVDALHLLGIVRQGMGENDAAEGLLSEASRLAPANADILHNLGVARRARGRFAAALEAFEGALRLVPASVDTLHNVGELYRAMGELEGSRRVLERCVVLQPRFAPVHNSLGITCQDLGDLHAAVAAYTRAITLQPNNANAINNLGGALLWLGRVPEALEAWRRAALLRHDHGQPAPRLVHVPAHRILHDAEQIAYLQARGLLEEGYRDYACALAEWYRKRTASAADDAELIEYGAGRNPQLAPSFNRIVHLDAGAAVPGGALAPALDVVAIERDYLERRPQYVVVDDFLRPQALEALRRYCWVSTVWKKGYRRGYLSAKVGHGFESPLLLQIVEELRVRFARIFGTHRLNQAWAFKHDSRREGVGIHADFAAVNVNLWISPEGANLDPHSGGLVLWDRESPADWPFADYNRNAARIRRFLRTHRARSVIIPHRANRVVLFNSTLFHETDRIRFAEGYEHRRINVTLLYGNRLAGRG